MLGLLFIVGLIVVLSLKIGDVQKTDEAENEQKNQVISKLTSKLNSNLTSADTLKAVALGKEPKSSPQATQKKITDEQFKNWLSHEVKNLEIPVRDAMSSEKAMKDFVNQLSKDQIEVLKQNILNSQLPINDRVFANYALTLFNGEGSSEILKSLIHSKMPEFKNVQVHSEDEVKRGQEYALKYMQIDSLFMRASDGDSLAKEFLIQIAQNTIDLKIQNYAQRKLKEIRY